MNDRGGTEYACTRTEWGCLTVGLVPLALSACAAVIDNATGIRFATGVYVILGALTVVGGVGWLMARAEARLRHDLHHHDTTMETMHNELRGHTTQRITYVSARLHEEHRPAGRAAVGGLDGESMDAARRISNRLRSVDSDS